MCFLFLAIQTLVFAQEFRKCPTFNSKENWSDIQSFERNEADVLSLLEWLCTTPPTEQLVERSSASIFVMEWVTRHPSKTIVVDSKNYTNLFISEDLMLAYLFGAIQYGLKHEAKPNTEAQRVAGLRTLVFMVEHSESYSKNKIFKSLLKASRRGELVPFDKEQNKNRILELEVQQVN